MAQFRFDPGGNELLLDAGEIKAAQFNKIHTGLSDFRVSLPIDRDKEDRVLDNFFLEDDSGNLLFRGLIDAIESTESLQRATTTLQGKGPAYRLETSEVVFSVTNELIHNAIDRFWSNETSFSPTVTAPSVSNTTTGTTAQEADTNSEFTDITTIADTDPLAVRNTNLELLQTCFTQEGEASTSNTNSNTDASDGLYGLVGGDTDSSASYTFNLDYTLPAEDFEFAIRYAELSETPDDNNFRWTVNGEEIGFEAFSSNGGFIFEDGAIEQIDTLTKPTQDLEPGTNTLKVEYVGSGSGDIGIDVIAPYDTGDRFGGFSYTFDNTVNSSSGYLDGPELFPDSFEFAFDSAATSWNITDGTLTTTWDDTTTNQRIQLRLGSQTWFPNDGTEDNTNSVTTDFGSEVGNVIQGRARLSRYGSTTGQTPLTGINGQKIQSWEITFDANDIPVIESETFEGSQLDVAQDLHQRAGMRFTIEHKKDSLPVESFRAGDVTKTLPDLDEKRRTTRSDFSEYFNDVTVRGQRSGGSRLSHNVSDSSEVSSFGRRHFDTTDPSLTTLNDLKVAARQLLIEKIRERDKKGTIEIAPQNITPGFSYDNPFDTGTIPIEETMYQVRNGNITGSLEFDFRVKNLELGEDIGGIRRNSRNTRRGF